ncbi:MAG: 23S rRNA (adenine(1618)-N(6))-methyltransferase RlmF [Verrucomicrobia bacterium]|nr:23S rRNA (adenine(1618)-N(6))-methyltransferase RlmF [Verrucomicrobiota bacterium]
MSAVPVRKSQNPSLPRGLPHPRNRHRDRYDFAALVRTAPDLARFVAPHPLGGDTINFSDPVAVRALNRAILLHDYGLTSWDIPPGYLCPPIPGRADYLHHVADLLAGSHGGQIPRGPGVAVLDIGVGANGIYPILGVHDYGWRFVGSDVDPVALRSVESIVAANPTLAGLVECRLQTSPTAIFHGIIRPGESYALTLCNPPFHSSLSEATAGTRRKVANLSSERPSRTTTLNFGGQGNELWCPGGEVAFVTRLIEESAGFASQVRWFTTLVSKHSNLPALHRALARVHPAEVRTIPMGQGQKQSRLLAWRL